MKKIISIVLAVITLLSVLSLTSCEKKPLDMLQEAAKVLNEVPYSMTLKISAETENSELQSVLNAVNVEMPITYDGNNLKMNMSMNLMEQPVDFTMSLVDKVLYYDMSMMGIPVKMKATLTEDEIAQFRSNSNTEMPINYTQFAKLEAKTDNGKTIITCSDINEEGKKAMNEQMFGYLEDLGSSAELNRLSYIITLKDGKYEAVDISCDYTISVEGINVVITSTMGATYSYDNIDAITAPADADSYTEVSFSDLLG